MNDAQRESAAKLLYDRNTKLELAQRVVDAAENFRLKDEEIRNLRYESGQLQGKLSRAEASIKYSETKKREDDIRLKGLCDGVELVVQNIPLG